ncbi:MAG: tetratricopeptide repeat protein [Oscillibacter sp.]|nr:tetratricopeptide repeat protein [Oscillibacter sp.]
MMRKRQYCILWAALLCVLLCACGDGYRKQLEQGRLQIARGQFEAAVATYSDVIDKTSRNADAYEGRGNAYAALADRAKSYGTEQNSYRRAALMDYKKACELDGGAEYTRTLVNYYLRLGDEALSATQDDAALTHAYSYEIADSYYRAAIDLDSTSGAAYSKMVALLLAEGKSGEAAALLEKALAVAREPAFVRELEALSAQIAQQDEQARRADALRLLRSVPYYGDPEACRMSAAQAVACAKLLSDGVRGKFYGFSGYGKPLYDKPVFWDEPYPVLGYGSYETDRGRVMLADLAGDGVPYLCLFSTMTENNSFEIYGWVDGQMKLAAGEESWGGQQNGTLTELPDGSVVLVEAVTMSGRTHSGQTFRFRDGGAFVAESWYEARENGEAVVRVTRDNTQLTYPRGQWEPVSGVSPENREAPYTSFADTLPGACPLRDMVSYLNDWAAAVSDGAAEYVEVPPEHTERHRMATAMLRQLFALDHASMDANTRLCYVRLFDCNGDGADELFAAFSGAYHAQNGAECQFVLYEWRDGELREHPGGTRFNELYLARRRADNARGVLGTETRGMLTRYGYTFLNGTEEFQADSTKNQYEVLKGGQAAAIAESEYVVLKGQYETLERLVDFRQLSEDRNYERVVTSLYNMRS